ncbi:MAG: class I SAM-dependent RNA methyltransferase, partial [Hyphomicrobiales bacterium]|nr:class I SAM-dependent RNA methyltransferase [Hyphomicrobiales bacterium]
AGLDVAIDGSVRINDGAIAHLAKFAVDAGFARLSLAGEVLLESRPPILNVGGTALTPPPGGFVQALAEAEVWIAGRISEAVGDAGRVADLFCGSGAFALRLAHTATVYAVESDPAAVVALERAIRRAEGLKKITTERRDLFRRPLRKGELDSFEAVVLDPPRAGAKAAVEELAGSAVPKVISISCNPATFARDARILVSGGYRLGEVVPLDQFRYSSHVELFAAFHRA